MADKRAADERLEDEAPGPDAAIENADDTEGHLLMPNIAAARALVNNNVREGERNARARIHRKDDRPGEKRGR